MVPSKRQSLYEGANQTYHAAAELWGLVVSFVLDLGQGPGTARDSTASLCDDKAN